MGLGTTDPQSTLHVTDFTPDFRLQEFGTGEYAELELNGDILELIMYDGEIVTTPLKMARPQSDLLALIQDRVVMQGDVIVVGDESTNDPKIRFLEAQSNDSVDFEFSNNFLRIKGESGQDLGKIHAEAPVGTFTTDAQGRTGYGTANPAASFNVKYRSAHGAVPVMLLQKPNNDEIFKVNFNGDTFVNGALVHSSDRNAKTAIVPVDSQAILDKVARLPISQWQYKDSEGVNHLGPMAQDFHAAFGLGDTNTGIATVDMDGVALASIQALVEENRRLRQALAAEEARNNQQDRALSELQADRRRLVRLEALMADLVAEQSLSAQATLNQ